MQAHPTFKSTIVHKNNETNNKFYRIVAFLMYTEMVNFRPQSFKAASKLKSHRGLSTTTMDKNYGKTAKNGVVLDTTSNVKFFLETIWSG